MYASDERKVRKIGNSFVVVVPSHMIKKLKWDDKTILNVKLENDNLIYVKKE